MNYCCFYASLLIVVEGTKTPRKFYRIFSCVGEFKEVIQCPAGEARQSRPRRHAVSRRLGGRPKVREVPGTEVNNHS